MEAQIDAVDEKIITLLRRNGRSTNVFLARQIGVTESTIRKRIDRLLKEGVIKVTAAVDPRKLGYRIEVIVSVNVELEHIEQVASTLAEISEIQYLAILTGTADIIARALFRSDDDLYTFLNRKLASIPGIKGTTTAHVLRSVKRVYDVPLMRLPQED